MLKSSLINANHHYRALFFENISSQEIIITIQISKKNNLSLDVFDINYFFVGHVKELFAYPLEMYFNDCFQKSIFPQMLKNCNIVPIHEGRDNQKLESLD